MSKSMDNKKIIMIHLMDPLRPAKGGAIRYTLNILKYILSKGYNVLFIGTQSTKKIPIDTQILDYFKEGKMNIMYVSSTGNLIKYIVKLLSIPRKEIEEYKVIHSQRTWFTIPLILKGFTRKTRIITTVHAPPLETLKSSKPILAAFLRPFYMFMEYLSFIYAHSIIFVSKSLMDYYRLSDQLRKKAIVIPGGVVDTSLFKPPSDTERKYLRRKLGLRSDDIVLLFVGRLDRVKRVSLIIESLKIVLDKYRENTKLIIVGDGPERPRLEKLAKEYGIENNVIFTGSVSPKEVVNYYKVSDILCLTSLAEASPNVIKEALAVGVPFIATNVSSEIQELSSLGVGLAVPKYISPEKLAEIIVLFTKYIRKNRQSLKKRCRKVAELYDIIRVMKYIEKLYNNLITYNSS